MKTSAEEDPVGSDKIIGEEASRGELTRRVFKGIEDLGLNNNLDLIPLTNGLPPFPLFHSSFTHRLRSDACI